MYGIVYNAYNRLFEDGIMQYGRPSFSWSCLTIKYKDYIKDMNMIWLDCKG